MPWLATSAGSFAGVVAVMLLATGIVWLVSQTGRGGFAARGILPRCACSGAAGHGDVGGASAVSPADGMPSLLPLVQQAVTDFGLHWLGTPRWSAGGGCCCRGTVCCSCSSSSSMAVCCCRCIWCGGRWRGRRVARRLLSVAPLALLTVALYGLGFWLLLQPMQMRGVMMGGM